MSLLGWTLRLVLVFVFAAAVLGKLRAGRAGLTEQAVVVRRLGVREGRARPVAVGIIAAEVIAGVLTAWPATAAAGCAVVLVLLAGFTGAVARLVAAGSGSRCRCFGGTGAVLGREHVVRNLLLTTVAVAALAVTAPDDRSVTVPVLLVAALVAAAPAAVFVFWDDLVAVLSPLDRKV